MNEAQIMGNWKEIKGQVKEKWGKLTEDDLMRVEGKAEYLAGKIQERYGKAKDEASKEVKEFFQGFENRFDDKKDSYTNDRNAQFSAGPVTATIDLNNLGHSVHEMADKVAKTTAEMSEKTISSIKKHPVQTALAVGAVGLIAGAIVAARK